MSNTTEKTRMSNDFDIIFEAPSRCCGEGLHWEWDESELRFDAECGCMKRYHLQPTIAQIEHNTEEFEDYDD